MQSRTQQSQIQQPQTQQSQSQTHWIVRLLYNNNPFYLISGLIILFALHSNPLGIGIPTSGDEIGFIWGKSFQLAGWMAAYSVIMAFAAVCVVRIAKIWEDARTIYLIVILATLGMSVIFDQLSIQAYSLAAVLLVCGLVFSILLVEVTLRVSKLKLPIEFRVPTYLLYAVFFMTPVLLASGFSWVQQLGDLKVVVFPLVSSLVFLTLLPAIRQGRQASENNGSPWIWPYYPWSLFIILLVGVLFRSSALAVSFGPIEESSLIINPFFLTPLAMVALVLLMEIALVEKLPSLRKGVMTFSPLFLVPGIVGPWMPLQTSLMSDVGMAVALPVVISGWCLVLVYLYFFHRGIVGSRFAASLAMAILAYATSQSGLFGGNEAAFVALGALPFLVEMTSALTKRTSQWDWVSSGLFFGFWVASVTSIQLGITDAMVIGSLAIVLWFMTIGLIFDSTLMSVIRGFSAIALGTFASGLAWISCVHGLNPMQACLAIWMILGVSTVYFLTNRRIGWKRLTQYNAAMTFLIQINLFKESFMPLIDSQQSLAIAGGVLFFVVGVLITSVKAGTLDRIRKAWNGPAPQLMPGF